jgi:glutamyl-tRNA synthetase
MGVRQFEVKPENNQVALLISREDLKLVEDKPAVRLMDLFNFKVETVEPEVVKGVFLSESYEEARCLGAPLIHWLPFSSGIRCEVVLTDASVAEGVAEDSCKLLKPDDIVQFQRFGFVRIDKVDDKVTAYFAHK